MANQIFSGWLKPTPDAVMTQSIENTPSFPKAPPARRAQTLRTVAALMLREMSTTYGRSALGYLWAILEPAAGIILLTFVFSLAMASPPIGSNFPLFYASGILPFMAYLSVSNKVSQSIKFSRPLLFYPSVTFLDALFARFALNGLTEALVGTVVLSTILMLFDVEIILDPSALATGFTMALALAFGIGTLNCFLLTAFPLWERIWAVLNRPLFIVSCIFFIFDDVPQPYQDYLWWNPIVHVIGMMRSGIYVTYEAAYVSPLYVYLLSLVTAATGLLLLRRYHSDLLNN